MLQNTNWIVLVHSVIQIEYRTVDGEPIESLRLRIREQTSTTNIGLGVCYTQSDQEGIDEAYKKPHIHKPWSLWGMLTIPISAGKEHGRGQAMQEVSGAHG